MPPPDARGVLPLHPARAQAGCRGFTLLETLVALAIAAIALVVLFEASGAGLRASDDAVHVEAALARAQSHLVEAETTVSGSSEHTDEGDDGAYHWRRTAVPAGHAVPQRRGNGGAVVANDVTLFRIDIVVSWEEHGTRHAVRLSTSHLAASPPHGA